MSPQKAITWSVFWVMSALFFAGGIACCQGINNASTFLTAYVVEKMLSVDNLFMFYIIFEYMGLGFKYARGMQRKALNWGTIGAIVLRGAFIFSGCFLVNKFNWLLYIFAGMLGYTSIKLLSNNDSGEDEPPKLINKIKERFPNISILMLAIIVIEITDIIFAMDSIPAILSITQDNFLVYSSNLFAILGLRSMYFVLLGLVKKFIYLQQCIAVILGFIAIKIFVNGYVHISPLVSLAVITLILTSGIIFSSIRNKNDSLI